MKGASTNPPRVQVLRMMVVFVFTLSLIRMSALTTRLSQLTGPSAMSQQRSSSEESKNVIVTLLGNDPTDVDDMCRAVKSLLKLQDEGKSPVLIFHEETDTLRYLETRLRTCAEPRRVMFAPVDFQIFPVGFDPETERSPWSKRSKFGYMQMIRFFVSGLWKRPELDPFDTVMRLDSDACWDARDGSYAGSSGLPGLEDGRVYHANVEKSDKLAFCEGIFEVAENFIRKFNIKVASPTMWEDFQHDYFQGEKCEKSAKNASEMECKPFRKCRMFYNNFEVVRKDFFLQPMVKKWHEHLADEEPFGILRHRWGDAVERYLTIAIFANESTVQYDGRPKGYHHPCCPKGRITPRSETICPVDV